MLKFSALDSSCAIWCKSTTPFFATLLASTRCSCPQLLLKKRDPSSSQNIGTRRLSFSTTTATTIIIRTIASTTSKMNSSSDRPSITVEVQGRSIPVVGERNAFSAQELQKVIESVIFKNWVAKINKQTEYKANSVTVQSIDMFGPRIGFIKFVADVSNDKGIRPPGVVFMRGGAVAILLILTCDGEEYTILTCQPRVPIADFSFPEIPAGMIDGSGHFVGKAAQELKEETGIEITEDALVDMTSLAYGDKFDGVYPSPGGCDEFLRFFLFRKAVTKEFLKELEGKCTGLIEENESITLKVVPLRDAWRVAPDAKLLSSLCLYDRLKQENKLPPPSQL